MELQFTKSVPGRPSLTDHKDSTGVRNPVDMCILGMAGAEATWRSEEQGQSVLSCGGEWAGYDLARL